MQHELEIFHRCVIIIFLHIISSDEDKEIMEVWDNCTSRDHDNSLGGVDLGRIRLLTGDAGQSPTETIRVQELSRRMRSYESYSWRNCSRFTLKSQVTVSKQDFSFCFVLKVKTWSRKGERDRRVFGKMPLTMFNKIVVCVGHTRWLGYRFTPLDSISAFQWIVSHSETAHSFQIQHFNKMIHW